MKFSELYALNEKFTGHFDPRDFGDAIPNMCDVPEEIGEYSRIESYAHNKDSLWHFAFDDEGMIKAFFTGTFSDPVNIKSLMLVNKMNLPMVMKQHPSDPTAFAEYSGVEPIKPPFKNYSGTYHIPKEFKMSKFNPYGSFSGIRSPEEWSLN